MAFLAVLLGPCFNYFGGLIGLQYQGLGEPCEPRSFVLYMFENEHVAQALG